MRNDSSSGGIFFEIASSIIESGGVVFGAAFTKEYCVEIKEAVTLDEIKQFMTSKYVQSIVGDSYQRARQYLEKGRKVLFCGTPCQIEGLYRSLCKNYEQLVTVEVICHGMPKKKYWKKYLELFKQNEIAKINFRDKTEGVSPYSLRIEYKNGRVYRQNLYHDLYLRAFLNDIILMDSCYKCPFKGMERRADITIGDLWGADELTSLAEEKQKGISLFWIHTEYGRNVLNRIRENIVQDKIDLKKAITFNGALLVSPAKTVVSDILEQLVEKNIEYRKALKLCVEAAERGRNNWHKNDKGTWEYFCELRQKEDVYKAAEIALTQKHNIAIVGPWTNKNHGGALTYYALYEAIADMGYYPYMISQPKDSEIKPNIENCGYDKIPYPQYAIAPIMDNMKEMERFNDLCDNFIVGSDQWFNRLLAHDSQSYMNLRWVNATKKKFAYAASFGYENYDGTEYERAELANYLQKFDAFSVRELSGIELVKKNFNIDAIQVLDPVFLCPPEKYNNLIQDVDVKTKKSQYLFAYIMDIDADKNRILKKGAEILNLSVLATVDYDNKDTIPGWTIDTVYNLSHEEWLAYIKNASFIVTDSFHGMCFALIFQKQFIAVVNSKRGSTRFETMMKLLGLDKNIVYDLDEIPAALNQKIYIDYNRINQLLQSKKKESIEFLKKILQTKKKTNDALSDFDILYSKINGKDSAEIVQRIDQNEDHLNRIDKLFWEDIQELYLRANQNQEHVNRIDKLFYDSIQDLYMRLNQNEEQIRVLREENARYKKEIDELKNSDHGKKSKFLFRREEK